VSRAELPERRETAAWRQFDEAQAKLKVMGETLETARLAEQEVTFLRKKLNEANTELGEAKQLASTSGGKLEASLRGTAISSPRSRPSLYREQSPPGRTRSC